MSGPPRSPLNAFRGEVLPGIGHNRGPSLDGGRAWRRHCWRQARKALMPRLPVEIVRRRVARATALGLEYPQYASILLGTGRDILAFLFTSDAIGLRLEKGLGLPEARARKLRAISGAERLLMTPPRPAVSGLVEALEDAHAIRFRATRPGPGQGAGRAAGRDAIRALLAPLALPGDAVVMIGTTPDERAWADAAGTAKFLPAERYFTGG